MTLAAIDIAWLTAMREFLDRFGYYPGLYGLAAIALSTAAMYCARIGGDTASGMALLAIAVQMTCFNVAATIYSIFFCCGSSIRERMQLQFDCAVVNSLTVPMFFFLPALLLVLSSPRWPSRRFTLCLLASVAACVVSTIALVLTVSLAFGTLLIQ